ncbi:DUF732 domain-containing protein [Mycolicibacterium pulveris]|uniref:DUF732 domain-containing protein n=1 Tax=Mycolicibacterium pulveris TaxID=36813 RepID=UPI003CEA6770
MRGFPHRSGIGIAVAAIGFAWLAPVAPAHADDESYLDKLRATGVVIPLPAGSLVQRGHVVCDFLHRGLRPENEESRYFPTVGMPQLIQAAQSELCPDTLA